MQVITLELAAVGIVVISAIVGGFRGLIKTLYHFVKLIIAIALSIALAPLIASLIPQSVTYRLGISAILVFVIVCIILSIIGGLLSIVDHLPVVRQINHFLGAVLGLLIGLLFVFIALTIIGLFSKEGLGHELAQLIKQSDVLLWLYKINPITQLVKQISISSIK